MRFGGARTMRMLELRAQSGWKANVHCLWLHWMHTPPRCLQTAHWSLQERRDRRKHRNTRERQMV